MQMTVLQKVGLIEKAWEVSELSVQKFPKSVPLWKQYLLMIMSRDSSHKQAVFDAVSLALKSVKDKVSGSKGSKHIIFNLLIVYIALHCKASDSH